MKKISLLCTLSLITVVSFSQIRRIPKAKAPADSAKSTPADAAPMQDDKMKRKEMFKELDLTKEQKIKMKELKEENQSKIDEVNNDTKLSDQDKKIRIRELRKLQLQNIQAILTDEQKEKFKTLQTKN